ncbi:MAG: hypothetical protein M3357_20350 [Actinomycetota bacterium]|nr:hypothetical protein [Actinomycetota bacterium]
MESHGRALVAGDVDEVAGGGRRPVGDASTAGTLDGDGMEGGACFDGGAG